MSHPYEPGPVKDAVLREELARLQFILGSQEESISMQVLHAEPVRYWPGMFVLADGSDWNPDGASGEGLYRRNVANDAWVFIG